MIRDAHTHAADDKRRRAEVDLRNQVDSLAYRVERTLRERGATVPLHEKARAEQMVADARAALQDRAGSMDRLRTLASDLEQIGHSLSASAAHAAGAQPSSGAPRSGSGAEDVVDAEYTETS